MLDEALALIDTDAGIAGMTKSAYEVAKAGGKHGGFYANNLNLSTAMLLRGIRSMRKRIEEHQAWMEDPYLKVPATLDQRHVEHLISIKWPEDIVRIEAEIAILQGIFDERGSA